MKEVEEEAGVEVDRWGRALPGLLGPLVGAGEVVVVPADLMARVSSEMPILGEGCLGGEEAVS